MRVKRGYRATVLVVTLLVYVASSLPYLYGYLRQTAEERFTGIVFDVVDTAQYYAWMRSFSHQVLIANPLTPEPGADRYFNLQWWVLGHLAYGTPLGPNGTYQFLRVIALAAFAVALAAFCDRVVRPQRALAFTLVMVSSGFGWVLVILKQVLHEADLRSPLAVQIAEANTFFSAMAFPHLLVAGALSLAIFYAFLRADDAQGRARGGWLALAAALTLALGFAHGYDLLPVMAIPGATAAVILWRARREWRDWLRLHLPPVAWNAAAIVVAALPPALYVLSLTRLDATWRGVLSQYGNADVFTPAPPQLVILLGLPFLLALPQLRPAAWRTNDLGQIFLRVWAVAGFALLYIPTNFQVKMLTAYQVPIGLLAAQTLGEILSRRAFAQRPVNPAFSRAAWGVTLPTLVLGFAMLTNGYLTTWRMIDLRRAQYPYYLSAGDVRALEALDRVAEPGQVVLSSPALGIFVPVYSDARPFVAHWAQTLHYFARRDAAAWAFTATTSDSDRQAFITANNIRFVLVGPAEAQLGGTLSPVPLSLERLGGTGTILYRTQERIGRPAGTVP